VAERRRQEEERQRQATARAKAAARKPIDISPIVGVGVTPLAGYSSNYGWELIGVYPEIGVDVGIFRFTAFGGGGLSFSESVAKGSYNFGGNAAVWFLGDVFFIGVGGGMGGPKLTDNGNSSYPFVRLSFGLGGLDSYNEKRWGIFSLTSLTVYYDYNFDDKGFKFGLLLGLMNFLTTILYGIVQ
jgi:hypothetical protein